MCVENIARRVVIRCISMCSCKQNGFLVIYYARELSRSAYCRPRSPGICNLISPGGMLALASQQCTAAAPPQKNDSISSSVRGAKGESAEKMHTACTDRRLNCKSSRRRAAFVWNGMSQCRTGACCCRTRNILCVDNVQHTHFSCSSGDKSSGYANSDKYSVMCNSSYNLRWKLFLLGYVCCV